jgi:transposase InsO family protein
MCARGACSAWWLTLEAPSATSVGLCLAHAAADKQPWLERLGAEAVWPMSGKPRERYVDNAAEFKSEALRRGCEQHGIRLRYRPPGQPHFAGVVEQVIGTTFSSTADRGGYDSGARAVMTLGRGLIMAGLAPATRTKTPRCPEPRLLLASAASRPGSLR